MIEASSSRHPKALFHIAFSAAFYCIGFGLIASLLTLYLIHEFHFTEKAAYELFGAYFSLIFGLPLVGGYLGSYFGFKRALLWANVLITGGSVLLGFSQGHLLWVYLGLALFATGTSIYAPNYLTLQGKIYAQNDARRESGYTLSYVITNLGFLIASVMAGYIQKYFSYETCFLLGALICLIPLALFYFFIRPIEPHPETDIHPLSSWPSFFRSGGLIVSSGVMVGAAFFLLSYPKFNNQLLIALGVLAVLSLLFLAFFKVKPGSDRIKLLIFLVLSLLSLGFWIVYTLEPSLLTVFVEKNVNRVMGGFEIPAPVFYGLNPFFVVTLGLVLSYLWVYLRRTGRDFSLTTKFTLSLFSLVIGLLGLSGLIFLTGYSHLMNVGWIVLVYAFLTLAELLISPIGQSMVGRLAPRGFEGGLMGVWQMFAGVSAAIGGFLGAWFDVPEKMPLAQSNPIYFHGFLWMGLIALGMAIVALFLRPMMTKILNKHSS